MKTILVDDHHDEDEDDPFGPYVPELNRLDPPSGTCAWQRGCNQPAAHNVCQYDALTMETALDVAVDANFCEPHAHAMYAIGGESEVW